MQIGFIGLGNMGAAMAANLLKGGHDVTVWNRSAARAEPLAAAGAKVASTPREAARGKAALVSMLADDAALDAAAQTDDGFVAGLDEGALHVSMSTIGVATAARYTDLHRARGQRFISAPVFGRPDAAAAARLFIVAAGAAVDVEFAEPLFGAMGRRTMNVGAEPRAANLVKLCGNFMILSVIESLAEAMALAEKGGVKKATLLEVLTSSLFDAPVFHNYGNALVSGRFRPAGFTAPLGLKDIRLVGEAAEEHRVPMPLCGILRDHLLQTIAIEGEDVDWSAIGLSIAKNGGL